jgi:hypothetical protein
MMGEYADISAMLLLLVTLWFLTSALNDLARALREPKTHNIRLPDHINVVHRDSSWSTPKETEQNG